MKTKINIVKKVIDSSRGFARDNPFTRHGVGVDLKLSDPGLLKKAKLDWTVEEQGLYRTDVTPVTSKKALVRSDTKNELGIVGSGYHVFQNVSMRDTFSDVAGVKDMIVEAAGCLGSGELVWMLAAANDLRLIKGDDISETKLLICNSHDGSSSLSVTPLTFRLICSNGLRMLTQLNGETQIAKGYKIRHTSGMMQAMHDVATAYAKTMKDFETTRAAFSALTSKPLNKKAFEAMMNAAFADKRTKDESDRAQTIAENRLNSINTILASPTCQLKGTAGTLWAGLNSITEYIDHVRPSRSSEGEESNDENRFAAAHFGGTGSRAKDAAFAAALSLV